MVGLAHTPVGDRALFGLAVAESVCFPLPPDLLLLALSFLNPQRSWDLAALCTLGSALGGVLGYALGRFGGRPVVERFVSAKTLLSIERQFQKYDVWAIAIAGFTPIPYKVFTISGGLFRIHFWRFVWVSLFSRGARFFLVAAIVVMVGEPARRFLQDSFEWVTVAFMVLLVGGFLVLKKLSRFRDDR